MEMIINNHVVTRHCDVFYNIPTAQICNQFVGGQ